MENTHMHRLKILQYCKVKGEREVNPIYLSMKVKVKQLVAHSCPTLCDPMYCSTPPGSSVRGFFRQEYWSGLPCPSPGDLPDSGIEPGSPTVQADFLPSELPGKPIFTFAMPTISGASGREPICQCRRQKRPMDKEAWQATVHRAAKSWAGLKWLKHNQQLHFRSGKLNSYGFIGIQSASAAPPQPSGWPRTGEALSLFAGSFWADLQEKQPSRELSWLFVGLHVMIWTVAFWKKRSFILQ